jgi:hypothetical protein
MQIDREQKIFSPLSAMQRAHEYVYFFIQCVSDIELARKISHDFVDDAIDRIKNLEGKNARDQM